MSGVVISSDWHPDAATAGFPRFEDVRKAAIGTAWYACEKKADLYIFEGDLITNDPALHLMIQCLRLAMEVIELLHKNHIPSLWVVGNHDVFEDGRGTTVLDPLMFCPGATVANRPLVVQTKGGARVLALPYAPVCRSYDPVETLREAKRDGEKLSLIAGHLMLEGIAPGSETEDMPRGRDVFFPIDEVRRLYPSALMSNGHYHKQQIYRGVQVPGALARLTRGETKNRPGFLHLHPRSL